MTEVQGNSSFQSALNFFKSAEGSGTVEVKEGSTKSEKIDQQSSASSGLSVSTSHPNQEQAERIHASSSGNMFGQTESSTLPENTRQEIKREISSIRQEQGEFTKKLNSLKKQAIPLRLKEIQSRKQEIKNETQSIRKEAESIKSEFNSINEGSKTLTPEQKSNLLKRQADFNKKMGSLKEEVNTLQNEEKELNLELAEINSKDNTVSLPKGINPAESKNITSLPKGQIPANVNNKSGEQKNSATNIAKRVADCANKKNLGGTTLQIEGFEPEELKSLEEKGKLNEKFSMPDPTKDTVGEDNTGLLGKANVGQKLILFVKHEKARSQINELSETLDKLGKKEKLRATISNEGQLTTSTIVKKNSLLGKSGKSEETRKSAETALSVMEGIMKDGPQDARKDVFHALRSFQSSSWGKSVLKSNPNIRQRFDAIAKEFEGPSLDPSKEDIETFKQIANTVNKDMENAGYKEVSQIIKDNKENIKQLFLASGMDGSKRVNIVSGHRTIDSFDMELQELLGITDSDNSSEQIIDSLMDEIQYLIENPEVGFDLVASKEYATRKALDTNTNDISSMNVIQKVSKYSIPGTEIFNTYTKLLDKMVDGFCKQNIIEPERKDADEGDNLRGMHLARNQMIESKLSAITGFDDFVSERSAINEKIHELRRGNVVNHEEFGEVLNMIKGFQEKYTPLAEAHKNELAQIRKEVPPKLPQMYKTWMPANDKNPEFKTQKDPVSGETYTNIFPNDIEDKDGINWRDPTEKELDLALQYGQMFRDYKPKGYEGSL